jgi:copper homeostasis protein
MSPQLVLDSQLQIARSAAGHRDQVLASARLVFPNSRSMPDRFLLEICVESADHAVAAERGGAHRIELCSDLPSGGITASAGFMQTTRRLSRIPIHVLIRPRAGDFCYSNCEFEIMRNDISAAKQCGMDGVVLGILHAKQPCGHPAYERLGGAGAPFARNLPSGVRRLRSKRSSSAVRPVFSSGGRPRAMDGLSILAHLVKAASGRILSHALRRYPCRQCGAGCSDNIGARDPHFGGNISSRLKH